MNLTAYPVILQEDSDGIFVTIPDLDNFTQGESIADAIAMARDAISLLIVDYEDDGKEVPKPNTVQFETPDGAIVTYVDVDIEAYRKKYGSHNVKKNCTLPAWLNTKAEEMGINFSQTLQEALLKKIEALSCL